MTHLRFILCGLIACVCCSGCAPQSPVSNPQLSNSRAPASRPSDARAQAAQERSSPPVASERPAGAGVAVQQAQPDAAVSPLAAALLIEKSQALTRLIFSGAAEEAHQLFSPEYRAEASTEAIAQLSQKLRNELGTDLQTLTALEPELGQADATTQTIPYRVLLRLQFANGKQALASVQFYLPADEAGSEAPTEFSELSADSASLAAIDVRETWESFAPATVATAKEALRGLLAGSPAEATPEPATLATEATAWVERHFHPQLAPQLDLSAMTRFVADARRSCGPLLGLADWSNWTYATHAAHLSAWGTVETTHAQLRVQLDFSDERLIGLTLIGRDYAASTLDCVTHQPAATELGKKFWSLVLGGQPQAAYDLLPADFQSKMSLSEFTTALHDSELLSSSPVKSLELGAFRLANGLERPSTFSLSAYYLARLEDETLMAVQCEFSGSPDVPQLVAFTNSFEATVPVRDAGQAEQLLRTFWSGDPAELQKLLAVEAQAHFVSDVAAAFLRKLIAIAGKQMPQLAGTRILHHYQQGSVSRQLTTQLITADRQIPFEAVLQADGRLQSFSFTAPELQDFLRGSTSLGSLEEQGSEFLRQWMTPSQTSQAAELMLPSGDPQQVVQQLVAQRNKFLTQYGNYLWSDLSSWSLDPESHEIHAIYEMEFANQTLDLELRFVVNAIGARIGSAQVLAEVGGDGQAQPQKSGK